MEVMESDLTCCVCLEIFVYPLMLPCTHNLCRQCVLGLTHDEAASKFFCPKCRQEIHIDRQKGIDTLPRNLALDNLANLFRNKTNLTSETICKVHEMSLAFYCLTCKCLICSECKESKHSDFPHNVAPMKQLIAEERAHVQDLTKQVNNFDAELKKNIRTVQRAVKDVKLNEDINSQTVEQSLTQLIAAINTARQLFLKKIQQDAQMQLEQLEFMEQDYRRLQTDIHTLRSQMGSKESSDLIQQYKMYQNMKLRLSSFLAFKSTKVSPPQPPSIPPVWRLHNAQEVYHSIQTLDFKKEPLSPVMRDAHSQCASHSLPASPKHVSKPSIHQQNSLEYSSDGESRGQLKNLSHPRVVVSSSMDTLPLNRNGHVELSSNVSSFAEACTNWVKHRGSQPQDSPVKQASPLHNFPTFSTYSQRFALAEPSRTFSDFTNAFSIAAARPHGHQADNSECRPHSEMLSASRTLSPASSAEVEAGSGSADNARPFQFAKPNDPIRQPENKDGTEASSRHRFGISAVSFGAEPTTSRAQLASRNPFENNTFSFTVGSSDRSASKARPGKGKKKRDSSATRSHSKSER